MSEIHSILLQGVRVEYELRFAQSRARRGFTSSAGRASIRLRIHPEKGLVVTISNSKRLGKKEAEEFIRGDAAWVLKNLKQYEQNKLNALPKLTAKEIENLEEHARILIVSRLVHFNAHYNLSFGRLSIRNQKTRWGSCSNKKNLSFNYKIALLPAHLADYIIVHELCHVAQMNHSAKFWSLVAETIPDYAERRKELRLGAVHPG